MVVRIGLVAAVLATFVVIGMPWRGASSAFQPTMVAAAPADTTTNGLTFSKSVDSDARAIHPDVEFGRGTEVVWASFDYTDHDGNAKVTYLVRANGEDYRWGTLDCCKGGSGRAAFPIEKRSGHGNLPGAAYEVRVYVNGAEVAVGGFGVKGGRGLDNDGQGHGNDND
ncbi:MAG: hypothetical protein IT306_06780 [Chloroflexi bacterium]|nr:hypothetical protein [Chloroflexota bacterium]